MQLFLLVYTIGTIWWTPAQPQRVINNGELQYCVTEHCQQ